MGQYAAESFDGITVHSENKIPHETVLSYKDGAAAPFILCCIMNNRIFMRYGNQLCYAGFQFPAVCCSFHSAACVFYDICGGLLLNGYKLCRMSFVLST